MDTDLIVLIALSLFAALDIIAVAAAAVVFGRALGRLEALLRALPAAPPA